MLKISTIKDKFVINHDDKTTVIPFSDFISFTLFQYSDGKTYKSEVNFISEKNLIIFLLVIIDTMGNLSIIFIAFLIKIHLKIKPQLNPILLQLLIILLSLKYKCEKIVMILHITLI